MTSSSCATSTPSIHLLPGWANAFDLDAWLNGESTGREPTEMAELREHWGLLAGAYRRGHWAALRLQLERVQDHYWRHPVVPPVAWVVELMLSAWSAEGLKHLARWADAHDHFTLALTQAVRLLGVRQFFVQTLVPWFVAEIVYIESAMGRQECVNRIVAGLISQMGLLGGAALVSLGADRPA